MANKRGQAVIYLGQTKHESNLMMQSNGDQGLLIMRVGETLEEIHFQNIVIMELMRAPWLEQFKIEDMAGGTYLL